MDNHLDKLFMKINIAIKLVKIYSNAMLYHWEERRINDVKEDIKDIKRSLDMLRLLLDEYEREVMENGG